MSSVKDKVAAAVQKANSGELLNREETALVMGVSRQRSDQIEASALQKIRRSFASDPVMLQIIEDVVGAIR